MHLSVNMRKLIYIVLGAAALTGLYFTHLYNYLLFHSLAELFSIIVAMAVFVVAWNARKYIQNPYLMLIGIAYLFVGAIDLLHTLTYEGMNIFPSDGFYANQFWVAGRYMESVTLLVGYYFLYRNRQFREEAAGLFYGAVTALFVLSILVWKNFPVAYIEGIGQTWFKIVSGYIIMGILAAAFILLILNRERFEPRVARLLGVSIILTILSEMAFTTYISNYGRANLTGHFLKIISFFLIYLAIVRTGLTQPLDLTFRELSAANSNLLQEIEVRKRTEQKLEKTVAQLQDALNEVKTLSGLLPICAACKSVRDDKGYWNRIESYIQDHSDAQFSHGICPSCAKELYPDIDLYPDRQEEDTNE
ncbi:MAG: hypothetical protein GF372_00535 [Candidatus Marinimicrobia bacterium]|nr:hypothetical protein [Candidatus Neomarinimicrobiota bacterium]